MARFLLISGQTSVGTWMPFTLRSLGHTLDLVDDVSDAGRALRRMEYDGLYLHYESIADDAEAFLESVEEQSGGTTPVVLFHLGRPLPGERERLERRTFRFLDDNEPAHLPLAAPAQLASEVLAERCKRLVARAGNAPAPRDATAGDAGDGWADPTAIRAYVTERRPAHMRVPLHLPRRQFHASSPAAAVEALVRHVRDWPRAARETLSTDNRDGGQHSELRRRDPPLSRTLMRLEDQKLRRGAMLLSEPARSRTFLALALAKQGWRWRLDAAHAELVVADPQVLEKPGGVLHSETGPAVHYEDGWVVHALHGEQVDRRIIERPSELTLDDIRAPRNAELRRTLRERFGERRYLLACGAALIDVDTVPIDGLIGGGLSITRALLEDDEGRRYLVASDGSTHRVYHMRVPPDCQTCQEADEALSGRTGMRSVVQA